MAGPAQKTSTDLYAGILKSRSVSSEMVSRFHLIQLYKVKKESDAEKDLNGSTVVTVDPKFFHHHDLERVFTQMTTLARN